MNIKITYNWLLEYLDTDATPQEIQKYLSLCGPSVERIDQAGDDWVMDIEITSNRVDSASVFGVAQEAQAILPLFGKRAKLKFNPIKTFTFSSIAAPADGLPLTIKLENPSLASRVTAVVVKDIQLGPSPDFMKQRLELCDIRSINNVVDITNYLMLALGQPTHAHDYDALKDHVMIMRESKPGETVVTLDKKEVKLPGGDIVIEDGSGKLIDLAGIMGGLDTSTTEKTRNIVLFIQTYNKQKIRRTSMTTGQRSVAATYFEKGLDEERTEPAIAYGVQLLKEYAAGSVGSPVTDIYPNPYAPKSVVIAPEEVNRIMGVHVEKKQMKEILDNLGFSVTEVGQGLSIEIPSWRRYDIEIKEDIAEEVARVYGYHNLPNVLPPVIHVRTPRETQQLFANLNRVKYFLKHLGLNESLNYSMISRELITALDGDPAAHLEISNTISEEIRYLRTALVPSLLKNLKDNEGRRDTLRLFEIAKTYAPRAGELPDEQYRMAIAVNTGFFDLKGIIEAMLREFHIEASFEKSSNSLYLPQVQAKVIVAGEEIGVFGQLRDAYRDRLGAGRDLFAGEFGFVDLMKHARVIPTYVPANPYATIRLDITITAGARYADIAAAAKNSSDLVERVELVDTYRDTVTLRFYFASRDRNITEEEAKQALETVKAHLPK